MNHTGTDPWDSGTTRHNLDDGIIFESVTVGEVGYILGNIEIGKSSGMEHINSNVLKIAFICLVRQLTHLFNCSLRCGEFPTVWAHGTITPIPKCGDSKLVGNWRPIALVPLPGKIMERLVHRRLLDVILEAGILSSNQYGFVPGRSTSQAIFKLHKDLTIAVNNGNLVTILYVDISKAFDSIHHGRLLNKLSALGLDNFAIDWLGTYLSRTQTTVFNDIMSSKH